MKNEEIARWSTCISFAAHQILTFSLRFFCSPEQEEICRIILNRVAWRVRFFRFLWSFVIQDPDLTGFNEISYVQFFCSSLENRDRMSTNWLHRIGSIHLYSFSSNVLSPSHDWYVVDDSRIRFFVKLLPNGLIAIRVMYHYNGASRNKHHTYDDSFISLWRSLAYVSRTLRSSSQTSRIVSSHVVSNKLLRILRTRAMNEWDRKIYVLKERLRSHFIAVNCNNV